MRTIKTSLASHELHDKVQNNVNKDRKSAKALAKIMNRANAYEANIHCACCGKALKKVAIKVETTDEVMNFGTTCAKHLPDLERAMLKTQNLSKLTRSNHG